MMLNIIMIVWYSVIALCHLAVFLLLIQQTAFLSKRMLGISIVFTLLVASAISISGYSELNLLLLLLLIIIGLPKRQEGMPVFYIVGSALLSYFVVTILRIIVDKSAYTLYLQTPFYYGVTTQLLLPLASALLLLGLIIVGRKKIVALSAILQQSKWYPVIFVISLVGNVLLMIASQPKIAFLQTWQLYLANQMMLYLWGLTLLLGLIVILSIHFTKEYANIMSQKQADEELMHYMQKLEATHEELAAFRHDYMNILLSLDYSIRTQDLATIEKTYYQVVKPTEQVFNQQQVEVLKLSRIANIELKSLYYAKVREAQQQGIQVYLDIPLPLPILSIERSSLIRMMAILLDNAIEAAASTEGKEIYVSLFETPKQSYHMIIRNTYANTQLSLPNLFQKQHSTKGAQRGLGLYYVQQIVRKHPQLTLQTTMTDQYFTQHVQVTNYAE